MTFKDFLLRYGGKLFGALMGLTAGILFLTLGFWKTILLLALMVVGWLLGGLIGSRFGNRMKHALKHIIGEMDEE